MTNRVKAGLAAAAILVPAVWVGLLIGVSFIATPVKFSAPSLTLAAAIDVGRVTFGLFNMVEGVMAALVVLIALLLGGSKMRLVVALVLGALVLSQTLWLLPALDARSAALIAGEPREPSIHHTAYALVETVKLALLIVISVAGAWKLTSRLG